MIVEEVAALVLALGHDPVVDLLDDLSDLSGLGGLGGLGGYEGEVQAIGDCLAPRTVEEAVLEGLAVASSI